MQSPESQNNFKPILMNKYYHKGFFMNFFFLISTHSTFSTDQVKVLVSAVERNRKHLKNLILEFFFLFVTAGCIL